MNNAAVNFHGSMFSFLLGIYLRGELLGHMIILLKTFEELPDCFLLFALFYISTSRMVGFQFVYLLANTYHVFFGLLGFLLLLFNFYL